MRISALPQRQLCSSRLIKRLHSKRCCLLYVRGKEQLHYKKKARPLMMRDVRCGCDLMLLVSVVEEEDEEEGVILY